MTVSLSSGVADINTTILRGSDKDGATGDHKVLVDTTDNHIHIHIHCTDVAVPRKFGFSGSLLIY